MDALREAEEVGLDLVEVAGGENPPVCKIMDYGKMAYQAKKKKHVAKGATEMKEISFSMKIGPHDIETKLKQARQFVAKGHKLRFNLILRGRERAYVDTNGMKQLQRIVDLMSDVATVEQMSTGMIGNRLFAILAPAKLKVVKPGGKDNGEAQAEENTESAGKRVATGGPPKPSGSTAKLGDLVKLPEAEAEAVPEAAEAPGGKPDPA
jgi:translation initiation factor IF-3